MIAPLRRRLLAEFLGSAFLAAIVIGSGIAAQQLSPGNVGLELLENAAATATGLFAIMLMFGPVSGAHFNPVVSLVDASFGGITWGDARSYTVAQIGGCITGAAVANGMFARAAISISTKHRASPAHLLAEVVATLGLLLVIFSLARTRRGAAAPAAVGAYIGAAYFFTSSTSFANPAIGIGRMFSDSFAGITPASVPAYVIAQLCGAAVGVAAIRTLYPHVTPADAADVVLPHSDPAARPKLTASPPENPRPNRDEEPPGVRLVAVGGSDAGISAALRARELDPSVDVTVVVADAYPNFSICGIPYYVSGEVAEWRNLAHRTLTDLENTGMRLRLNTRAQRIDPDVHEILIATEDSGEEVLGYDALIVGTGAVPVVPPIAGLADLGPEDGVHLMHSMGDAFALMRTLQQPHVRRAVIVGAGYIGLEMAEALTARGLQVTQLEQLPEVLPTVDGDLGAMVHAELERNGVAVACATRVDAIQREGSGPGPPLEVRATGPENTPLTFPADLVLIVVGVRPDTELAAVAGARLGVKQAIDVDRHMRTSLRDVLAAGDCAVTHHRLLGPAYLPLGTTAHKQGRVAAETALGGSRPFAGSLGTQVVKVFDLVAARTGLRDHEARIGGFDPITVGSQADDHKRYYPGSHPIAMRYTGDQSTGRLLGLQLIGLLGSEIAKRIDIAATAMVNEMTIDAISDLDLSYAPPLGSPWDALQIGAQTWIRDGVAPPGGRAADGGPQSTAAV